MSIVPKAAFLLMTLNQEQFRVSLATFDGPLDLLLYLVRRAEVDIYDIPIAQIADEYLEVLRQCPSIDVEMAGEFLVMAASLIELKSRLLVPPEEIDELEQEYSDIHGNEDPREDLIRQLLAFQRIRTVSELLENKRIAMMQRFDASSKLLVADFEEPGHALDIDDVHVIDLSDAYEHIASAIDFGRMGEHHVAFEDMPIELFQEDLIDRLSRSVDKSLSLNQTLIGLPLQERVGMFLATLELVRLRHVTVLQENSCGDIIVALVGEQFTQDEDSSSIQ